MADTLIEHDTYYSVTINKGDITTNSTNFCEHLIEISIRRAYFYSVLLSYLNSLMILVKSLSN